MKNMLQNVIHIFKKCIIGKFLKTDYKEG